MFLLSANIVSADVISIVSYDVVPLSIKDKVAREFRDVPRMLRVIQCESKFRQFDSSGKTLRSKTSDIGVGQINQVHWKRAKALGLDIWNSVDDNIKMMRIIYEEQGIDAWTCNDMI